VSRSAALSPNEFKSSVKMFGLLRRRKEVIDPRVEPESGRAAEAVVEIPPEALKDTVSDSKIDRKSVVALKASEAVVEIDPPEAVNATLSHNKIDREAVVALNVKAICDLAGFLPDRAKYESFRDHAMVMALSLQDGPYSEFAVAHVAGLCRRSGEVHVAMELYGRVTNESLRERILKSCPELRPLV
jgi:hypothetical protein